MQTIKVGDVVAWEDVQDGMAARWGSTIHSYVMRVGSRGWWFWPVYMDRQSGDGWPWMTPVMRGEQVTITALDLTGSETAADLQRLAEVFDGVGMKYDDVAAIVNRMNPPGR